MMAGGHALHLGALTFRIECNAPTVKGILLRQRPIVGFPILPDYTCEFETPGAAAWRWYRLDAEDVEVEAEDGRGVEIGRSESYVPTAEDIGKFLAVEIIPARQVEAPAATDGSASAGRPGYICGRKAYAVAADAVVAAPDLSVHQQRRAVAPRRVTQKTEPGVACEGEMGVRVVSYNILADAYANTKFAREQLYHYCPSSALRSACQKSPTRSLISRKRDPLLIYTLISFACQRGPENSV